MCWEDGCGVVQIYIGQISISIYIPILAAMLSGASPLLAI